MSQARSIRLLRVLGAAIVAASLGAIVAASLGACGDGGSGASCLEPERCSASPIGDWQLDPCAPWERLGFVAAGGLGAPRTCELLLDDARIVETDRFTVAADGTYARTWSARGRWSGVVAPECVDDGETACAALTSSVGHGATGCVAAAAGCRCEGTLDLSGEATGTWRTGSGQIVLEDDDGGEETSNLCAGERRMRLDPPGGRARRYRPFVAPPPGP